MVTHDNAPPPPDWTPPVGNLCGNCLGTANLCDVLIKVDGKPCCGGCSHARQTEPLVYEGDQA